jgi:hypothetical protein
VFHLVGLGGGRKDCLQEEDQATSLHFSYGSPCRAINFRASAALSSGDRCACPCRCTAAGDTSYFAAIALKLRPAAIA